MLGVSESEVTPEATFSQDLGADSFDALELIVEFEDQFDIKIPEYMTTSIVTVGDAIRFVENALQTEDDKNTDNKYLPFISAISSLSPTLQSKLKQKKIATEVHKCDKTSPFVNLQTTALKLDEDRCAVMYVGYMFSTAVFMIQIDELYLRTLDKFGKIECNSSGQYDFYLDTEKGKRNVPFFTELFLNQNEVHVPCIIHFGDIFVAQQFYENELEDEEFMKKCMDTIKLGLKLHQEYENARVDNSNSSYTREIAYGIKLLLHIIGG